jgi:hypothetical protein
MPAITPITAKGLTPFEGTASPATIRRFQVKIGSLLYTAVITRPDVAFTVSKLARFNSNPRPKHYRVANRVLRYLKTTRIYALIYGRRDNFEILSDASFIDNLDRKSSQAYAIKLFGGLIV